MKDLLLCSDFYPVIGGAHHWLYNVYRRWPNPVTVFAGSQANNDAGAAERQRAFDSEDHASLSIHRIDLPSLDIDILDSAFWKRLITAVRLIAAETGNSQATLHCLRSFPDGVVGLAWKALAPRRRRIVTFAHGEEITAVRTSRQLRVLGYWVYKVSALVIANCLNTETLLRSLTPSAKISVIHPGVSTSDFAFPEKELEYRRASYGFAHDDIVLVAVSRLAPHKNHANVLKSIRRLLDLGMPLKYLVVGGGEEEQNLRTLAKDLGLDQVVKFAGVLSDRERSLAMAIADIHIMPSILLEGFGIVFIEAAAAGIPSIAGNVGGQVEAVLHGKTGLVIDGTDMNAIVGAIRQLAENRQLRREMGEAGRRWAAAHEWQSLTVKTFEEIRRATRK